VPRQAPALRARRPRYTPRVPTSRPGPRWPRRILHVTPFLWSGAGAALVRLAEAQRAAGSTVGVVTTGRSRGGSDWPAQRQRLRRAGVAYARLDFYAREPNVFWPSVEGLGRLLARFRPDVVHAHAGVPACALAICRDRGAWHGAAVATLNSWGLGRPAWMDVMDAWGLARLDRVVCIARAYQERLVQLGVPRRRLRYVPWGIDLLERVSEVRAATDARPIVGFVGRIEPRKNQLAVVEAFARVRRRWPDLALELVGPVADHGYADIVARAIADAGLDDAVRLTGPVPDVAPYVRRWCTFVSASHDEGQGLAVLEAMALGVPVVAARTRGIEDYLDASTGIVVPRPAPAALARGVEDVLRRPGHTLGRVRRARRLVVRRYAWPVALDALAGVYAGSLEDRA
jgi:glycosyltransferase involved in cell wall biosynthesis